MGNRSAVAPREATPEERSRCQAEVFRVIKAHRAELRRRALWLARTEHDAADLFQDTVERALRRPAGQLADPAMLRWLNTIMHNSFLDKYRAGVLRRWVPLDAHLEETLAPADLSAGPPWIHISDRLLRRCIARLPFAMREIVELQLQGHSYADLARRAGVPTSTMGTRLMRARKRLRQLVDRALDAAGVDLQSEINPAPIRYRRGGQSGRGAASKKKAPAKADRSEFLGVDRNAAPPISDPNHPGKALPCH